ncbi:unnamed protein product [Ilex paraguariensis]|uniref:FAD/NAD(P)-binding domain-containing protein n=1 Tax=Ilex paraguariensis TaxID=185542 RepID=A0ABC8UUB4_9AQUA
MENPEQWGGGGRRVVVIGGGVAGSFIAKSLQFHADVTLIDPKDYFEIPWASLRAMVEPSFAERSVIHHKDYLTNGHLIVSSAINITDTEVLTSEGRLVTYDYLVIATGHNDPSPKNRTEKLKQYQAGKTTEHQFKYHSPYYELQIYVVEVTGNVRNCSKYYKIIISSTDSYYLICFCLGKKI